MWTIWFNNVDTPDTNMQTSPCDNLDLWPHLAASHLKRKLIERRHALPVFNRSLSYITIPSKAYSVGVLRGSLCFVFFSSILQNLKNRCRSATPLFECGCDFRQCFISVTAAYFAKFLGLLSLKPCSWPRCCLQ